jgi:hypothetical protein
MTGEKDSDESRDRLGWHPTREEFQAYLDREVVMALDNIRRGFSRDVTLHSARTMALVFYPDEKGVGRNP